MRIELAPFADRAGNLPGFHLRGFEWGDANALARHANSDKVAANLRDAFPHPYTLQDARDWIRHMRGQEQPSSLAIASPRELVGSIGVTRQEDIFRCTAELGYWLGEKVWGRGIATAAVRAIVPWAFRTLGLLRLQAHVLANNAASGRVLEKAGFRNEGCMRQAVIKGGQSSDVILYSILREELSSVD